VLLPHPTIINPVVNISEPINNAAHAPERMISSEDR
jgi:hypothetical protein